MNEEDLKTIKKIFIWVFGIGFVLYMLIAAYGIWHPRTAAEAECEAMGVGVNTYELQKKCVKLVERREEIKQLLKELEEAEKMLKLKDVEI